MAAEEVIKEAKKRLEREAAKEGNKQQAAAVKEAAAANLASLTPISKRRYQDGVAETKEETKRKRAKTVEENAVKRAQQIANAAALVGEL